jgi:hypothetical protein
MTAPRHRRRQRKEQDFSAAELEWLTGEPREDANPFIRLELRHLTGPDRIEAAEALLARARPWLPKRRVRNLERQIDTAVKNLREYEIYRDWPHPRARRTTA